MAKQSALANIYAGQADATAASKAGDRQFLGGMIGTGATIVGGMYGGPAGAAVAGGAANAVTGGGGGGQQAPKRAGTSYQPGPRRTPQPNMFQTQGPNSMIPKKKLDYDPYANQGAD